MCIYLLSVDLTTGTIWGSMHQRVGVNGFGSWRMSKRTREGQIKHIELAPHRIRKHMFHYRQWYSTVKRFRSVFVFVHTKAALKFVFDLSCARTKAETRS